MKIKLLLLLLLLFPSCVTMKKSFANGSFADPSDIFYCFYNFSVDEDGNGTINRNTRQLIDKQTNAIIQEQTVETVSVDNLQWLIKDIELAVNEGFLSPNKMDAMYSDYPELEFIIYYNRKRYYLPRLHSKSQQWVDTTENKIIIFFNRALSEANRR
ncbi:MAG: hypothetical protein MJ058_08935 [Akkermansia sp.]|nr:hypothetical protein [Akkermansia sp.]